MYCTHCGEFNPSGTTRCAHCGQALAPAPGPGTPGGRRCPMCGKVNAADATFCAACGARVVPLETLDEEDLDILRPPQEAPPRLSPEAQMALNYERQRELFTSGNDSPLDPDVARRLTASPPEDRSRSRFALPLSGGSDGGLSWLDSLRGSIEEPASPGRPAGEPEPSAPPVAESRPAPAGPPTASEAPLPAWMNPPPAESAPPSPAEPALPAWLSQPPTPAPSAPDPALPAWLSQPPAPPAAPSAPDPALPAWLSQPPAPPAAPSAPDPALPAWLSGLPGATTTPESSPAPATPASGGADTARPAWLNGLPTPSAEPAPAPAPAEDTQLPAWLRTFNEEPPESSLPSWLNVQEPEPEPPPWMHHEAPAGADAIAPDAAEPAPAEPAPAEPAAPAPVSPLGDIELPGWLRAATAGPLPPPPVAESKSPSTGPLLGFESMAEPGPAEPAGLPGGMLPSAPAGASEDFPDWMAEPSAAAPAGAAPGEPPSAATDGLPAWMSEPPAVPASAAPAAAPAGDGLPTWMGEPIVSAEESDTFAPAAAAGEEGLPAWMAEPAPATGAAPPVPAQPSGPAASADSFPAWMNEPAAPAEAAAPAPATPAAPPGADGFPAWMNEPAAPAEAAASAPATPAAPPGVDGFPAWMNEPAAPASGTPAAPPGADGLPAWMNEPVAPAEAAAPAPATPTAPAGPDGFPAWMSEPGAPAAADASTSPSGEGEASPPAAPAVPIEPPPASSTFLSEEDLPAWLRAIQTTPAPATPAPALPPAPTPVEPQEEEVPAWLRALGGAEEDLVPVGTVGESRDSLLTPMRIIRARAPRPGAVAVFERLLAPPVEAAPAPAARRTLMSRLFTDRLVHLLLLLVVIGGWLLTPLQILDPSTAVAPKSPEGAAFYSALTGTGTAGGQLAPGKPVLLVYDWDASRYGEMYPLSLAVTRILAGTGHPLVTVSTLPEGASFAQQVTASAVPTMTINCGAPAAGNDYGTRFLNLGYLPGNEAALAQLVTADFTAVQTYDFFCYTPARRFPLLQSTPRLDQFGGIVLLAGNDLALRLWIEQVAGRLSLPVFAALPEALRPAAQPYLSLTSGNARLRQAVFGIAGAQEVTAAWDNAPQAGNAGQNDEQTLGQMMHAEAVALFFVTLVLLIGFIVATYRWINRRSLT